MKVLLSIFLVFCLAFTVNSVRVRTHTHSKSQSATSQWQVYLDSRLSYTGMSGSAMISATDGTVWASKSLNLKAGEGAALIYLFKNPSSAISSGITVNGIRYITLTADSSSIIGKSGSGGVVLVKTGKAIIVSTYGVTTQPATANLAVQNFANYIKSIGF